MRWRWKQRDFTFRSRHRHCCLSSLRGSLRSDNATATRTSLKKWICVLSVFTAIIPTTYFVKCTRRTLLKLNFKWPYSSSEREIKFRRCLFTSPLKREIRHFSRRSRAKTGKKCTKKRDTRAKLLFAYKTFCFFSRSRCRPRRWILKSLISFTINVIIIMNIIFTIITLLSYS